MELYDIKSGNNKLGYRKLGNGKEALLAFHGFGQESSYFTGFAKATETRFTLYSIDLFFHGNSLWHDRGEPLSEEVWFSFVKALLQRHQIQRFSLIGYSLGGKLALLTCTQWASRIDKLILIAPDGIKTNLWYSLATYPYAIRKAFRKTVNRPRAFFLLVKIFRGLGLLDKGVARFAKSQMHTRPRRYRVYATWMVLRKIRPGLAKLTELINRYGIETEMYLGKYDRIITGKNMEKWLATLKKHQLTMLETGHTTLIEEVADLYRHQPLF